MTEEIQATLETADEVVSEEKRQAPQDIKADFAKEAKIYVPGHITSFSMLKEYMEAREKTYMLQELTWHMEQMLDNIVWDQFITDKGQAMVTLAQEFQREVQEIVGKGSDFIDDENDKSARTSGFFMTKQADGSLRWLAIWSANTEDEDRPPDIIAKAAFDAYVERLAEGVYPFPELWLYHLKGSKWGQADMVSFIPANENIGFAIASGTVDKGFENIGESFLPEHTEDEAAIGVSHGMEDVRREYEGGKSIIVHFNTYEISPLYLSDAAHKLTGFNTVITE